MLKLAEGNNANDNNNEILIKHEPLVPPELGALYRRKKKLEQYNRKNKLIHPWTVHQQIQPTSHTHTHLSLIHI